MSVAQAEFVAYKAEAADRMKKMEEVIEGTIADIKRIQEATSSLQQSYSQISLQAAPWSAAIQSEVAASEANSKEALNRVTALHEATRAEVT